jgi:HIRAN domain
MNRHTFGTNDRSSSADSQGQTLGSGPARVRLWLERERGGGGLRVRDAATEQLLRATDARVRVVKVAGTSYRLEALQDDAFAPGRRVALVPEPDNVHDPNAIGIWDAERQAQAGYIPADIARELQADDWQAVVLRDFFDGEDRCGLRVLLAPRAAWIGIPRE